VIDPYMSDDLYMSDSHRRTLLEENKRLRKSLEFYADPLSYEFYDEPFAGDPRPIFNDQGKLAREALNHEQ